MGGSGRTPLLSKKQRSSRKSGDVQKDSRALHNNGPQMTIGKIKNRGHTYRAKEGPSSARSTRPEKAQREFSEGAESRSNYGDGEEEKKGL